MMKPGGALLSAAVVLAGASLGEAQLTAAVFPNVAFAPASAAQVATVPCATLGGLALGNYTSVRLTGTVTPALTDAALNFTALSEGGVRLWVDDFLIIDSGMLHNTSAGLRPAIQTIAVSGGASLAFRLEYSRWGAESGGAPPTLTLTWQGAATPHGEVPGSAFAPGSSAAQASAAALRDSLVAPPDVPWQTYYRKSMGGHTYAPTGLVTLSSLLDSATGNVLEGIFIQRGGGPYIARAGPRSRNGSDYTQLALWAWAGLECNVTMETTTVPVGGGLGGNVSASSPAAPLVQLQFLASYAGADCGRLRLIVQPAMFDERVGWPFNASTGDGFYVDLPGFPSVSVGPLGGVPVAVNASAKVAPPGVPFFALPLGPGPSGAVGYCATPGTADPVACPSTGEVQSNLAGARAAAEAASSHFGALSDVYDGIAASVLWNTVWAAQEGVVAIVSRNPNWAGNSEFVADYVLFEWDSYFIATQAALEPGRLRDIGVATLVAVTLARTPRGFVPNWKSGAHSSYDRTENQVGALLTRRIADMLPPSTRAWVVDLLFPPLLTWHSWVWTSRTALGGVFPGEPLMVLGSDPSSPHDNGDGNMQGARYESMDNSAAYDAPPAAFNGTTHQIMQYDVSPTALFLSDTDALLALAGEAGRGDVIPLLAAHFNATAQALNARLWMPEAGAYVNRLFNGSFNPRIVPPALFPLLSGVASDAQAEALVALAASPAGFCVNASHNPATSNGTFPTGLLTRWAARNPHHSVGCVTPACTTQVLLYDRAAFQGVEAVVPVYTGSSGPEGGVPLNRFVSAAYGNGSALATAPPDGTFVLVQQEGWCFPLGASPDPGSFRPWPLTNLTLWVDPKAHDYRTCGTPGCENASSTAGYVPALAGPMCAAFDAGTVDTLPCVVPVPSVARSDPSFGDQNYWRGRAWGPQVALVYLGLKRYAHLPAVQTALGDLVALGASVMRAEWHAFGHIAENLNGITGFAEDSANADPFYAWGGCFALPALLEAGFGEKRS